MERFDVPARLFLASVACALLCSDSLPLLVRAAGAVPLVLYLPGRCLIAAVMPREHVGGELRAVSAALSLAVVALLGLVLDAVHAFGPADLPKVLAFLCAAGCFVSVIGLSAGKGPRAPRPSRVPLGSAHLVALVVAAGLAGFAYQQASRGAMLQRPDDYTDLWMVPTAARMPSAATVGVRNQEGREVIYALDIVARGDLIERVPTFVLQPGETRTFPVALPAVAYADAVTELPAAQDDGPPPGAAALARAKRKEADRARVEARLYRDGDRTLAYRLVWVALPAPLGPASTLASSGEAETRTPAPRGAATLPQIDEGEAPLLSMTSTLPRSPSLAPAAEATQAMDATNRTFRAATGSETLNGDLSAGSADIAPSFRAVPAAVPASAFDPSPSFPQE